MARPRPGWATLLRPDEQIDRLGSVGRELTGSGRDPAARPGRPRGRRRRGRRACTRARPSLRRLLEEPREDRRGVPRPVSVFGGRHGAARRRRLLHARRPHEQHHHHRRRERLPVRGRGRARRASEGAATLPWSAVPHDKWGEAVLAAIVPARRRACRRGRDPRLVRRGRIAGYKRPQSVRFVADAQMPRTATGKILHRVLRDRLVAS